eukprot:gene760-825_t
MGGFLSFFALNLCECAACMACSCFDQILTFTLSQVSRLAHFILMVGVFTFAIVLGKAFPNEINDYSSGYSEIHLSKGCSSSSSSSNGGEGDEYNNNIIINNCIYQNLIYRASLASVIFFLLLTLGSYFSDHINKGFWLLKIIILFGSFIGFWWVENEIFEGWAAITRIISFLWLVIQGLIFIDFTHDLHDLYISSEQFSPIVYLSLCFIAWTGAIVGWVFLFLDYAQECDLGMFFTILTLCMAILTTLISLLEAVGGGLLPPSLIAAYSTFLCWYALISNPDSQCNPLADRVGGSVVDGAVTVISIFSFLVFLYCLWNGSRLLNIFDPQGEGVLVSATSRKSLPMFASSTATSAENQVLLLAPSHSDGIVMQGDNDDDDVLDDDRANNASRGGNRSGRPFERAFFHLLFALFSCYLAMILTNWGRSDGAPPSAGKDTTSELSMWLKITSQWIFLLLYCKVLHVQYTNEEV